MGKRAQLHTFTYFRGPLLGLALVASLLAFGVQKASATGVAAFTSTLTTEVYSIDFAGYNESKSKGSLTPNVFNGHTITKLYTENDSANSYAFWLRTERNGTLVQPRDVLDGYTATFTRGSASISAPLTEFSSISGNPQQRVTSVSNSVAKSLHQMFSTNTGTAITFTLTAPTVDYDADDDGLLEISTLEQLDAIRHDPDGNGESDHLDHRRAFNTSVAHKGCPSKASFPARTPLKTFTITPGEHDTDASWHGYFRSDSVGSVSGGDPVTVRLGGTTYTLVRAFFDEDDDPSVLYVDFRKYENVPDGDFSDFFVASRRNNRLSVSQGGADFPVNVSEISYQTGKGPKFPLTSGTLSSDETITVSIYGKQRCGGYELAADLDFDGNGDDAIDADDPFWNGGAGWDPVGDGTHPFNAILEGNGRTISNLFVSRSTAERAGLFGELGSSATVRRLGLGDASVSGQGATQSSPGEHGVGTLAGVNRGRVVTSYSTGSVTGAGGRHTGGLVGWNGGAVQTSYSTADVNGNHDAGGLVGLNGGRVEHTYATGAVSFGGSGGGGLVGKQSSSGTLRYSYATGTVTKDTGATNAGGLLGANSAGTVTQSYFDHEVSNRPDTDAHAETTSRLQTPTGATGIFSGWGSAWDFGASSEYPLLSVSFDTDGDPGFSEFGVQSDRRGLLLGAPSISPLTSDITPNFSFTSSEAGTIAYGGSCRSTQTDAVMGSNTVTFETLAENTYTDCTVTVTDTDGNASDPLAVPKFAVVDLSGRREIYSGTLGSALLGANLFGYNRHNGSGGTLSPARFDGRTVTTLALLSQNSSIALRLEDSGGKVAAQDVLGNHAVTFEQDGVEVAVPSLAFTTGAQLDTFVDGNVQDENAVALYRAVAAMFQNTSDPITLKFLAPGVAPTLSGASIANPTPDPTPDFSFTSSEAGTIAYGGSCRSTQTDAVRGSNTVTFETLADDTYTDCTVTVTAGGVSATLDVPDFTVDTTAPALTGASIANPTPDPTPDFSFTSSEAGTIAYGGSCSSSMLAAIVGENIVTFNELAPDTYADCTVTVTDAAGNASSALAVPEFTVVDLSGRTEIYSATLRTEGWQSNEMFGYDRHSGTDRGTLSQTAIAGYDITQLSLVRGGASIIVRLEKSGAKVFAGDVLGGHVATFEQGGEAWVIPFLMFSTGNTGDVFYVYNNPNSPVFVDDQTLANMFADTSQDITVKIYAPPATDFDTDDDGLIEVSTLEQLDAIRHDPDGDGESDHLDYRRIFNTSVDKLGCPATPQTLATFTVTMGTHEQAGEQTEYGYLPSRGAGAIDPDPAEVELDGTTYTIGLVRFVDGSEADLHIKFIRDGAARDVSSHFRDGGYSLSFSQGSTSGSLSYTDYYPFTRINSFRSRNSSGSLHSFSKTDDITVTVSKRERRCAGYEFAADLDFDENGDDAIDADDSFWNGGAGWDPVGDDTDPFNATLEGNGHTISNLFVSRSSAKWVGLFGELGTGATVRNLGVEDASVSGQGATQSSPGEHGVGALAGVNRGTVSGSYATGSVTGAGGRHTGGLVGWNGGTVRTSYSTATVSGNHDAGSLVGLNEGTVENAYATGAVSLTGSDGGGLLGRQFSSGTLRYSYATGSVTKGTGATNAGGLLGANSAGTVTQSYFDSDASNRPDTDSHAKTTSQLQSPTSATGIFSDWGSAWDFGTSSDYPLLSLDFDGDGDPGVREFGPQAPASLSKAPVLAAAAMPAVTADPTPDFSFASDEAGDITYGGSCSSATVAAVEGSNTVTFNELAADTYADCTVTVTDSDGNDSDPLAVPSFEVVDLSGMTEIYSGTLTSGSNAASDVFGYRNQGGESYGNLDSTALAGHTIVRLTHDTTAADVPLSLRLHDSNGDKVFAGDVLSGHVATFTQGDATLAATLSSFSESNAADGLRFSVSYSNWIGQFGTMFENTSKTITVKVYALPTTDFDSDDDGLIEVSTLEQLNAIRHDLDGDGAPAGAGAGAHRRAFSTSVDNLGCPVSSSVLETFTVTIGTYTATPGDPFDSGYIPSQNVGGIDPNPPTVELDGVTYTVGEAYAHPGSSAILKVKFLRDGSPQDVSALFKEGGGYRFAWSRGGTDLTIGGIWYDANGRVNFNDNSSLFYERSGNEFTMEISKVLRCEGYELAADLDFDANGDDTIDADDPFWNGGAGWDPVGDGTDPFNATFEGNGHTISNLFVSRPSSKWAGFFGELGSSAIVRNLGLGDVDISGQGATQNSPGEHGVGALAGVNRGTVSSSYATGSVTGAGGRHTGGLVGWNGGAVQTSYSTADVNGNHDAGGFLGLNAGAVENAYATGAVSFTGSDGGGLVGKQSSSGTLVNAYAAGTVTQGTGASNAGGLLGASSAGTVTQSYFDSDASNRPDTDAHAKTTSQFQTPTSATGIFSGWHNRGRTLYEGTLTPASVGDSGEGGYRSGGSYAGGSLTPTTLAGHAIEGMYASGDFTMRLTKDGSKVDLDDVLDLPVTLTLTRGPTTVEATCNRIATSTFSDRIYCVSEDGDFSSHLASFFQNHGNPFAIRFNGPPVDGIPEDPWDFGTSSDYPLLSLDFDGDGTPSVREFGPQAPVSLDFDGSGAYDAAKDGLFLYLYTETEALPANLAAYVHDGTSVTAAAAATEIDAVKGGSSSPLDFDSSGSFVPDKDALFLYLYTETEALPANLAAYVHDGTSATALAAAAAVDALK